MATPTTAGRVIIGQGITVKGDIKNCEEVIVRGFFDAGNVEAKTVVVEADGEETQDSREGPERVAVMCDSGRLRERERESESCVPAGSPETHSETSLQWCVWRCQPRMGVFLSSNDLLVRVNLIVVSFVLNPFFLS